MRIAIVDYGLGNLPNVQKALARAGAPEAAITSDPEIVAGADGVVLPGVGAFRAGMAGLRARGLVEPLRAVARSGRPLLGICLGAQLFLEASAEWGETEGLGLIPGRVEPLPAQPPAGRVRLPHIGWNWVAPRQPHPLFRDLGDGFWAYFAHSYAARPADPADIAAETEHGAPFVSAVARGSVAGVQFHPEKSGAAGLALLANWVAEVRRWAEFTLYPAIDLRGGRAVRLRQGRPDQETAYGDPVAAARRWLDQGARALHLVDLDGAFTGAAGSANAPAIAAIVAEARRRGVPVQLGGGLRTLEAIAAALDLGVSRVVVGSRALDEAFMAAALARFGPDRIVAGIDAREGRVATHGWLQVTEVSAVDLARRLYRLGVRHAVYTDVSRDGTLTGPDWAGLRAVAGTGLRVVASGGIRTVADLEKARATPGVAGAIVGRALYEGVLDLAAALRAVGGGGPAPAGGLSGASGGGPAPAGGPSGGSGGGPAPTGVPPGAGGAGGPAAGGGEARAGQADHSLSRY